MSIYICCIHAYRYTDLVCQFYTSVEELNQVVLLSPNIHAYRYTDLVCQFYTSVEELDQVVLLSPKSQTSMKRTNYHKSVLLFKGRTFRPRIETFARR